MRCTFSLVLLVLAGAPLAAQQSDTLTFQADTLFAAGERSFSTASSKSVRAFDIRIRPRQSAQHLLELVPGLFIAQHGGGGKAEQIFMRGFDADHGTDVAISVDGVPVNMVSHAHGQGYADLHFVMPELVERVDVRKGPFDARDGDFATAGAIDFVTASTLLAPTASLRRSSFGGWHAFGATPFAADAYVAASHTRSRGFLESPQNHRRNNAFAKWNGDVRDTRYSLAASYFDAAWDMSGQVPERAVEAGRINRYGSIDPTEGGATMRAEVRGAANRTTSRGELSAQLYLVRYRFNLFSNFTFFARDSLNGDGIEQKDDRWMTGGALTALHAQSDRALTRFGVAFRYDDAQVGLFEQRQRVREETLNQDDIRQVHLQSWAQQEIALTEQLRLRAGVRADAFRFDASRGTRWLAQLHPKLNLAFDANPVTTLFASAGTGFHSNDARDVLAAETEIVLPRATALELGVRVARPAATWSLAAWLLDLESELVFVGDEGNTEANDRTRRAGVDAEARVRVLPGVWLDADANYAYARFRDEPSRRIPLAPTFTSAGGITLLDAWPFTAGLRYRLLIGRPADETGAVMARGYSQWQSFASWQAGNLRLQLGIDNLFDREWNEAQFATTSRLRHEPAPVTELHFTPGAPRTIHLGAEYRF